ncbi:hypothetical protein Fcan01_06363 [Folsomia candida]|uniref:Uncharacterized protein n=1 Tax=Folsomia candida TaxID=158441 RepID=A0A226EP23_FOLCA|nr:hypothetical protein Fcan01_06363 [Folsomia candida]
MSKMLKNSFASKGGSTSSQKSAVAQNSSIRGRHTTFPNPPAPHATKVPASLTKSELLNSHAIKDKIPEVGGVGQGNRLVVIQTSTKKSKAAPTEKSVRSSSAISYKNTCPPEYQGHWRSGNEIQTTTSGGVDYGEILGSTSDITAATIMFKGEGNNGHGRTKRCKKILGTRNQKRVLYPFTPNNASLYPFAFMIMKRDADHPIITKAFRRRGGGGGGMLLGFDYVSRGAREKVDF